MNKIMLTAIAAVIATNAYAATEVPLPPRRPAELNATTTSVPPVGCVDAKTVNKFLNDNHFIVLYRSQRVVGTFVESWLNGKNEVITISYKKPDNNNAASITDVCVVDFSKNLTFNGDTIDILNKSLEKVSPSI